MMSHSKPAWRWEFSRGRKRFRRACTSLTWTRCRFEDQKNRLLKGEAAVFARAGGATSGVDEARRDEVGAPRHAKSGNLAVELNRLRKKCPQLGRGGKPRVVAKGVLQSVGGGKRRCMG